uniref:Di19 zinc-binding domain-containing protein n=1 Tax=Kalanchoe fedtschenkoi TaxID=63787 RepID=A0A7N1A939_KALFE
MAMDRETLELLLSKQLMVQSQSHADPGGEYVYEYEEDEEEYDEEDDDGRTEFPCPYCSDDFDIVELCYHLESEHYNQIARNGVILFLTLLLLVLCFLSLSLKILFFFKKEIL